VILFNFSKNNVNITKGERIAQLIVEKIVPTFVKEIGIEEDLPITDRGEDGFGSTENKEENNNNNNINKKRKNS
jgi:dUTP pyrophosphatase